LPFEDATMPRPCVLLAVPLVAAFAGCYRPVEPGVAVSGRVTYLGKPVNASISFVPDIDKSGHGGSATIANGWYSIRPEDGLIPGEFNVLIVPVDKPGSSPTPDAATIPKKYKDMNMLRVKVPARKSFSYDFDLEPDPPPLAVESPGAVD
jgi:hypothetical protein